MNRRFNNLNINVQRPVGTLRTGTSDDGQKWSRRMFNDYGYIRRTKGHDDEQLDCYLGGHPEASHAYIIHQNHPTTNQYDEDKVMLGFRNESAAKMAYLMHMPHARCLGGVTAMPYPEFETLVKDLGKTRLTWKNQAHLGEVTMSADSGILTDFYRMEFSVADTIHAGILNTFKDRHNDALNLIVSLKKQLADGTIAEDARQKLGGIDAEKTLNEVHKRLVAAAKAPAPKVEISPEVVAQNQQASLIERAANQRGKRIKSLAAAVHHVRSQMDKGLLEKSVGNDQIARFVDEMAHHFKKQDEEKPRTLSQKITDTKWLIDHTDRRKVSTIRELNSQLDAFRKQAADERRGPAQRMRNAMQQSRKIMHRTIPETINTQATDRTHVDLQITRGLEERQRITADPGQSKQRKQAIMDSIAKNLKTLISNHAKHIAAATNQSINSRNVIARVKPMIDRAAPILADAALTIDLDKLARQAGRMDPARLPRPTVQTKSSIEQNRLHPHAPKGGTGKYEGGQFVPAALRNAQLKPRTDFPEKHGIVDAKGLPKSNKEMTPAEKRKADKVTERNRARLRPLAKTFRAIYLNVEKMHEKVLADQGKLWSLALAKKAVTDKGDSGTTYLFEVPDAKTLPAHFTDPKAGKFIQLNPKNPPKHFMDWVLNGDLPEFHKAQFGGFYVPVNAASNYGCYAFDRQSGKFKPILLDKIKSRNQDAKWDCVRGMDGHFESMLNTYKSNASDPRHALMWFIAATGLRVDSGNMLPGRYGASSILRKHLKINSAGDMVVDFMGKGTNPKSGAVRNYRIISANKRYDWDDIAKAAKSAKTDKAKAAVWERVVETCAKNVVYDPQLLTLMKSRLKTPGKPDDKFWGVPYHHASNVSIEVAQMHGIPITGRQEKYDTGATNPTPHRYRNYVGMHMGRMLCELYSKLNGVPKTPEAYMYMLTGNFNPGTDRELGVKHGHYKGSKFAGIEALAGYFLNDQRDSYHDAYFDPMIADPYKKKAGVTWPGVYPEPQPKKSEQSLSKKKKQLRKVLKRLAPTKWIMTQT